MSVFPELWHIISPQGSKYILGTQIREPDNSNTKDEVITEPFFQLILTNFEKFYESEYNTRRSFMKLLQSNGIDFRNPDNVRIILELFERFNEELKEGTAKSNYNIEFEKTDADEWKSIIVSHNSIRLKIPLSVSDESRTISVQGFFNRKLFKDSSKMIQGNKFLINKIKMKDQLIKFLLDEMLFSDRKLFEYTASITSVTSDENGSFKGKLPKKEKGNSSSDSYLNNDFIKDKIPVTLQSAIASYEENSEVEQFVNIRKTSSDNDSFSFNWNEITKVINYSNKLYIKLKENMSINNNDNDTDVDTQNTDIEPEDKPTKKPRLS